MAVNNYNNYVCVEDFRKAAEQFLDKRAAGYLYGAANEGITYLDNIAAFKRYKFRPKLLRDVSVRDLGTTLLSEHVDLPIGISPFAVANFYHTTGELALGKATSKMKTCFIQSHFSSRSVEEVNLWSPSCLKWIQIYIFKNREITIQLIKRCEKLGYKAVVLTVDSPVSGRRLDDMRNNFMHRELGSYTPFEEMSLKYSVNNAHAVECDPSVTWKDIQWLKKQTTLPIVIKGIMSDFDAREALNHGADGIMVSNHGGRQLDGVPATIDVLKEVVKEVGGACEVYLDGGVRTGSDVLKALALGARAVFIARPAAWGLACGGADGVCQILSLLKDELDIAMALCGQTSVRYIAKDIVVRQSFTASNM